MYMWVTVFDMFMCIISVFCSSIVSPVQLISTHVFMNKGASDVNVIWTKNIPMLKLCLYPHSMSTCQTQYSNNIFLCIMWEISEKRMPLLLSCIKSHFKNFIHFISISFFPSLPWLHTETVFPKLFLCAVRESQLIYLFGCLKFVYE